MPGGTAFYFSHAISNMHVRYLLVTALATDDLRAVSALRSKGIEVKVLPSAHTVFFENIYDHDPNHRTQKVLQKADPFTPEQLVAIEAKIFHLGPLLADDIPAAVMRALAAKAKLSLDVQGFLRKVENKNVCAVDWVDKEQLLPCIHFLKASEEEMLVLTEQADVYKGAKMLHQWGVQEVIITQGSRGSVIYSDNIVYNIPAYMQLKVEEATGCGDTYMAGYLYRRMNGATVQQAGEFAAAMATVKIETSGPFTGTAEEVEALLKSNRKATMHS